MCVCAYMYVHVSAGAHGGRHIRSSVAGVTDTHEPLTRVLGPKLVLLTTAPSFRPHFLSYLFNLCISCPLQWHRNPSRTGVVRSLYLMLPHNLQSKV